MKIEKITSQTRRDFYAIYVCEHCGHTEEGPGYDDDYFHRHIIPGMSCKTCGKTAGEGYRPMGTKYAEHDVV